MLCNAAHFFDAVANRLTRHEARLNGRCAKTVKSRQRRRRGLFSECDKVIKAYKFTLAILDRKHRDVLGHAAVLVTNRTDNVILAAILIEFAIALVTNGQLHRLGNVIHRHAFFVGLVTHNLDMQFRLSETEVRIHHAEHRALARFFFELGHKCTQDFDIRGLQHELHRKATALCTDALWFKHHHAQVRIFVPEQLDFTGDYTLRATRLLVVVQSQAHSRIARIPRTRLKFGIFVAI